MSSDRRLRDARRLTPKGERERYVEEWERELMDADQEGTDPRHVVSGATRVALRRRARWAGQALLGAHGVGVSIGLWIGLAILVAVVLILGGIFWFVMLTALAVAAVVLSFAGRPSQTTFWIMAASTVIGVCAAAYVWWVLGVQIDAADSRTPVPAAAGFGGLGLITLASCIVIFIGSAVIGYVRRPN